MEIMKTGRQRINRETKLPIYDKPVEHRINNAYKELTGFTKTQINKQLSDNKSIKDEIKELIFNIKYNTLLSGMNSLSFQNPQF